MQVCVFFLAAPSNGLAEIRDLRKCRCAGPLSARCSGTLAHSRRFFVPRASVLCAGAYKVLYLAEGCSRNSYIKVGQKRESWRVVWLAPYSLRAMAAIAGAASSKKLRYPQ